MQASIWPLFCCFAMLKRQNSHWGKINIREERVDKRLIPNDKVGLHLSWPPYNCLCGEFYNTVFFLNTTFFYVDAVQISRISLIVQAYTREKDRKGIIAFAITQTRSLFFSIQEKKPWFFAPKRKKAEVT